MVTLLSPVRSFKWDPRRYRLGICSGSDKLYLWSPEGASVVAVPTKGFAVRSLAWTGDGLGMVLGDRETYSVVFLRQ